MTRIRLSIPSKLTDTGFYRAFLELGTLDGYVLGAVLATVLQLSLSDAAMNGGGRRIPFRVAVPLGLTGSLAASPVCGGRRSAPAWGRAPQLVQTRPQYVNPIWRDHRTSAHRLYQLQRGQLNS